MLSPLSIFQKRKPELSACSQDETGSFASVDAKVEGLVSGELSERREVKLVGVSANLILSPL